MLTTIVDWLLALLFPDRCAGCNCIGSLLCDECRSRLQPYPGDLLIAGVDEVQVAYLFGGVLRPAIHAFKYRGQRRMSAPLGDLLAAYQCRHPLAADVLLPVPLHPGRLAERGFNQSELLTRRLAAVTHLPVLAEGLVRVRATGQQAHLDARERRENMRNAFVWQGCHAPPA